MSLDTHHLHLLVKMKPISSLVEKSSVLHSSAVFLPMRGTC